jgi:ribosome biogenesis protein Tsr3
MIVLAYQLTTAEAFASVLHILGEDEQAAIVLGKLNWECTFSELNCELLGAYAGSKNRSEA